MLRSDQAWARRKNNKRVKLHELLEQRAASKEAELLKALMEAYPENWNSSPKTPPDPEAPQAIADVKDPLRIRPMLPFEILLQALPQACPDHAECLEPKARGISLHTQARTHTRGMNRS